MKCSLCLKDKSRWDTIHNQEKPYCISCLNDMGCVQDPNTGEWYYAEDIDLADGDVEANASEKNMPLLVIDQSLSQWINREALKFIFDEYLKTLDDEQWDEMYDTQKGFATRQLQDFLVWLEKNIEKWTVSK